MLRETITESQMNRLIIGLRHSQSEDPDEFINRQMDVVANVVRATLKYFG